MGLVEGLDDAVDREYERLRLEIKESIIASDYTIGQVAALASIGEGTLYRILAGSNFPQLDTLLRIAFILGIRIEIARPEQAAPSFRAVPLATGSRLSSATSADSSAGGKRRSQVAAADQRKETTRRKRQTSWFSHLAA